MRAARRRVGCKMRCIGKLKGIPTEWKPFIEVSHCPRNSILRALGHREDNLREALVNGARRLLNTARDDSNDGNSGASNWIWALRDVNFQFLRRSCGIIGANGAGKEYLLKSIANHGSPSGWLYQAPRSTWPVLLEVGTGFHPDLNRRENIFLNGVMLGMTKNEIQSKFDEIVAFDGAREIFLTRP